MVKVRYIGPHDRVAVPLPDGRVVEVEHDGELPVSVPDEFAAGLLEQKSNWAPVKAGKPAKEE